MYATSYSVQICADLCAGYETQHCTVDQIRDTTLPLSSLTDAPALDGDGAAKADTSKTAFSHGVAFFGHLRRRLSWFVADRVTTKRQHNIAELKFWTPGLYSLSELRARARRQHRSVLNRHRAGAQLETGPTPPSHSLLDRRTNHGTPRDRSGIVE